MLNIHHKMSMTITGLTDSEATTIFLKLCNLLNQITLYKDCAISEQSVLPLKEAKLEPPLPPKDRIIKEGAEPPKPKHK